MSTAQPISCPLSQGRKREKIKGVGSRFEEAIASPRAPSTLLAGSGDESVAYSMKCLCLPEGNRDDATVVDHVRLFRNHPAIRWEHRVHEQILPGIRRVGGDVGFAEVVVQHTGYC